MSFCVINSAKFKTKKGFDGNNFLVAYDVPIAKTGVQYYTDEEIGVGNTGRLVGVYRDPSAFDNAKIVETFSGLPLVDSHPDSSKVDHRNYKRHVVGNMSEAYFKNGSLYAKKITVVDASAIRSILERECNELSIGFQGVFEKKKGIYKGEKYEYIEKVLHGNHLALCEKGKAGPMYAINSRGGKMSDEEIQTAVDEKDVEIGGLIKRAVHDKYKDLKPEYGNDSTLERIGEKEEKMEQHLKEGHAAGDEDEEEEKSQALINALKTKNKTLQRKLTEQELEILDLQNTLEEAREVLRDMSKQLEARPYLNAMTGTSAAGSRSERIEQLAFIGFGK